MPRRRIVAALLGGLFSLQLALSGTSATCPLAQHGDMGAAGAGATMPGMAMSQPAADGAAPGRAAGTPSPEAPCEHATSPKRCQSMAPCATGVLAPVISLAASPHAVTAGAIASIVSMPLSVTAPPELPPPRA